MIENSGGGGDVVTLCQEVALVASEFGTAVLKPDLRKCIDRQRKKFIIIYISLLESTGRNEN